MSILYQFQSKDPKYKTGFGQAAYDRAIAAGLTPGQIKRALPSAGLQIAESVGQALGGDTSLYQFSRTPGGFGAGALQRAREAGMTDGQIRSSLAMSGLRIGDPAAQQLNINAGKTYLGYAPGVQGSYQGNAGGTYTSRPQFAPRGYGMDGRFGSDMGFSPTLYIAGGENDYDGLNYVFGTNYEGGPNIGGGYTDPDFNLVNYIPPPHDPNRPFGGWPGGVNPYQNQYNPASMQVQPQTSYTTPSFNYSIPGGSKVATVKSPTVSKSQGAGSFGRSGGSSDLQIKSVNV